MMIKQMKVLEEGYLIRKTWHTKVTGSTKVEEHVEYVKPRESSIFKTRLNAEKVKKFEEENSSKFIKYEILEARILVEDKEREVDPIDKCINLDVGNYASTERELSKHVHLSDEEIE